jgi:hypothetical protein
VQQTVSAANTARYQFLDKARTRKKISKSNITFYSRGRLEKPVILQTVRDKILKI